MLRIFLWTALGLTLSLQPVMAEKPSGSAANENKRVEIVDVAGFFNETFNDFSEELETAREEGKKAILIMFEMDECPFCHRMKTTVLNRTDVQNYYQEHFLVFSVDIEGDLEITDFAGENTTQKDFSLKQFRVRATPVFQFFSLEGKPLKNARLTGAAKDSEEFLLLGKFIVEKHNEKQSFFKYKREHDKDEKKD